MTECFTIMSNEIENRIDPYYYKKEFKINFGKFETRTFGELFEIITDGDHGNPEYSDEGIPYLRVVDVKKGEIKNAVKKISKAYSEKLYKSCFAKESDLLISIVGTLGESIIIKKNELPLAISRGFAILSNIKNKNLLNYIYNFTKTNLFNKQLKKNKVGSVQTGVYLSSLRNIKIPIPPLEIRNKIVSLMDKAYSSKKSKETEAQRLLDSINDYVLSELGIKLPELKDKMTLVVYADEVKGKRIDAYYYQPKFKEIEEALRKGKFGVKELKEVLEKSYIESKKVKNGEKYILSINSKKGVINEVGVFGEQLFKKSGGTKREIKNPSYKHFPKSLVISRINIQRGGCFILDNDVGEIYSTNEFYSFKSKNGLSLDFIFLLIRNPLLLMLINKEISGQFGRFKEEQFLNLKIPLPPLSVQNKIAEEVKRRIQKAEQLQKEAKEELEKAKKEVEKIILG